MGQSAFLVIDMLNDYLLPDGLVFCKQCRTIIPNVRAGIEYARRRGIVVVYVNTRLSDGGGPLAGKWGMHAETGTRGAAVVDELSPRDGDLVVGKQAYNGFTGTELNEGLRQRGVAELVVTGIHTHVCVLLTAVAAFELGYKVTVLEDCIATAHRPNHDSRLRFFKTHVGELMTSAEWMKRDSRVEPR